MQGLAERTVMPLAPAIFVMTTSFVRIVVVIGFLRNALSTQNVPPNQVVIALSLFLTFYIMAPYWGQANENGIQPYLEGQITQEQALENIVDPMREFMLRQTRESRSLSTCRMRRVPMVRRMCRRLRSSPHSLSVSSRRHSRSAL